MLDRNNKIDMSKHVRTSAADTLKETLEFYHITQQEFAGRIGVSQKHLSEILSKKKFLTSELALKIEIVTGIPASFLLRSDAAYKLWLAKQEEPFEQKDGSDYLKPYSWNLAHEF
jgi:addiction module HigA family antidote